MRPYQLQIDEVLSELETTREGLSAEESQARLAQYGPNELVEKEKKTPLQMFLDQFKDFLILILIAAAVVSGVIGEPIDASAIVVIVVLNAVLGFTQEFRAEKAMTALKQIAAAHAVVIREGEYRTIRAAELVPGDIAVLEAGRIVPTDMRVIEAARLRVDEAALTGESVPSEKSADVLKSGELSLGDRKNMLYKGTVVTYGRGIGVVTATGMNTELGRIAAMIQGEEEGKTPLQKRLAAFGRKLAYAVLAICAIIFIAGLLREERPVAMFLVAVSLAVAAIPEALPAVVTIALAIGARKMVSQNALVRKLPAVETLGSVTYICSDKTGTLTENRMTVEKVWVDGKAIKSPESKIQGQGESAIPNPWHLAPEPMFFTALALSNDAQTGADGAILGDPTEVALYQAAFGHCFIKGDLERQLPRVMELPFDSDRKSMTTVHQIQWARGKEPGSGASVSIPIHPLTDSRHHRYISFTKGAVDILLSKTANVFTTQGLVPLDQNAVLRTSETMAAEGLRVLYVGMRAWDALPAQSHESCEAGLTLIGLAGMMDPPREEAKESVSLCKCAGIVPVMITGDHPLTARTIAKRVGILDRDDPAAIITGAELQKLSPDQFEKRAESIRVYARVAPEQKLTIVRALQNKGHFVAMTGDGVNDAPALKRADIGVAMGITGTDVAKEASSMILLDDNFTTIVKAVKEGRRIYDNIRKFVKYLLTTNSGEIWTLFLGPFLGLPIPLLPVHILWINLVTDGLPALALSMEPEEGNVMKRPPRRPSESLFAHGLGIHAVWVGLLMAAVTLSLQAWAIYVNDSHWQTMVFTVLCLTQLGHVMAIRSDRESLFTQGIFTNKLLVSAVLGTIILQFATVYVPVFNPIFKTQPMTLSEFAITLLLSSIIFIAVEIEKIIKRKRLQA